LTSLARDRLCSLLFVDVSISLGTTWTLRLSQVSLCLPTAGIEHCSGLCLCRLQSGPILFLSLCSCFFFFAPRVRTRHCTWQVRHHLQDRNRFACAIARKRGRSGRVCCAPRSSAALALLSCAQTQLSGFGVGGGVLVSAYAASEMPWNNEKNTAIGVALAVCLGMFNTIGGL
jgi:hypothetical protein